MVQLERKRIRTMLGPILYFCVLMHTYIILDLIMFNSFFTCASRKYKEKNNQLSFC